MPLTEESEAYVLAVTKLPDDGLERLKFFQNYLQHEDSMLTRDSLLLARPANSAIFLGKFPAEVTRTGSTMCSGMEGKGVEGRDHSK
mgnify:CR=1 FL=1